MSEVKVMFLVKSLNCAVPLMVPLASSESFLMISVMVSILKSFKETFNGLVGELLSDCKEISAPELESLKLSATIP